MDQNGFEEIYIVTTSTGSGSYASIIGLASNSDKSMTEIHVEPKDNEPLIFHGFMGHNNYRIEDNRLKMSYPIYLEDDTNSDPTGGTRIINYKLKAGEASWQMRIESASYINFSLSNLDHFPSEIMGCSCSFSKTQQEYDNRQFLFAGNYGNTNALDKIEIFKINGKKIIQKGESSEKLYEIDFKYDPDLPKTRDQDVQRKSGILYLKELGSNRILMASFTGVCAC